MLCLLWRYKNVLCPYCKSNDTKVIDSRESEDVTRRRRECLKCQKRYTTYERVESLDLIVIKKNNQREPYDREKIKKGLLKSFEKRPVSIEKIEESINNIETKLRSLKSKEIKSKIIGEEVMKQIKKLDKVAYVRFASVYREFKDVKDFEKEVKDLLKK